MASSIVPEKLLCVFCYKQVIKENQAVHNYVYGNNTRTIAHSIASTCNPVDALKICERFFYQVQRPVGHLSAPQSGSEKCDDSVSRISGLGGGGIVPAWNPAKMGICSSCFFAMESYVELHEKMERVQRKLKWQLDRFFNVVKGTAKIKSRVTEFEEHLRDDSDKPAMIDFRWNVYKICSQKLKQIEDAEKEILEETRSILEPASVLTPPGSIPEKENLSSVVLNDAGEDVAPVTGTRARRSTRNTTKPGLQCLGCPDKLCTRMKRETHASQPYDLKSERGISGGDEDDRDPEGVVECNVEIVKGSPEEQEELNDCLEKDGREESNGDSSDSDLEVQKNYKALMEIVQSLKLHNIPGETEPQSGSIASVTNGQKKVRITKPKEVTESAEAFGEIADNLETSEETGSGSDTSGSTSVSTNIPSKSATKPEEKGTKSLETVTKPEAEVKGGNKETPERIRRRGEIRTKIKKIARAPKHKRKQAGSSAQCTKCGLCFKAINIRTANTLLFNHLKQTNLHNGNLTWEHFCMCCGDIFLNARKLLAHFLAHHREDSRIKRFSCKHCNRRFVLKATLFKHFNTRHKNLVETVIDSQTAEVVAKLETVAGGNESNL